MVLPHSAARLLTIDSPQNISLFMARPIPGSLFNAQLTKMTKPKKSGKPAPHRNLEKKEDAADDKDWLLSMGKDTFGALGAFNEATQQIKQDRIEVLAAEKTYQSLVEKKTLETGAATSLLNKHVRAQVFNDIRSTQNPASPLFRIAEQRKNHEAEDRDAWQTTAFTSGGLLLSMAGYLAGAKFLGPKVTAKIAPDMSKASTMRKGIAFLSRGMTNAGGALAGFATGAGIGHIIGKYTSFFDDSHKYGKIDQPYIDQYNKDYLNNLKQNWLDLGGNVLGDAVKEVFPEMDIPQQQMEEPPPVQEGPQNNEDEIINLSI